jgi:hypothetical protein
MKIEGFSQSSEIAGSGGDTFNNYVSHDRESFKRMMGS